MGWTNKEEELIRENKPLIKALSLAEEKRDILKKATAYFRKGIRFVLEHRQEFRITVMCRVLQISRSGYYAWIKKPKYKRTIERGLMAVLAYIKRWKKPDLILV